MKDLTRRMFIAVVNGIDEFGDYTDENGIERYVRIPEELNCLDELQRAGWIDSLWRLTELGANFLVSNPNFRKKQEPPPPKPPPKSHDRQTCWTHKVRYSNAKHAQFHKEPKKYIYACAWCKGYHYTKHKNWTPDRL